MSTQSQIISVNIEEQLKQYYLAYSMSVIVGRALPDVRDGLKPVHRRVLYAMYGLSNDWNKSYKKSARIVGDVIGKYHPHGDSAVYDSLVRMAQDFSMRYTLIDGQGNFGSIDGDPPAAMRYTEIRMAKIAHSLLIDLEKETVNFVPNYDNSEIQPEVLPTRVPNLLVNGSSGIAVGMATSIPPHNLGEVINACLAIAKDPDTSLDDLMKLVPAPDFPTKGIINGTEELRQAYATGRGRVILRAQVDIEESDSGRSSIIVSELPYQVNKAKLIEKIAEMIKDKQIEGISALRDESDKDGMRMVIEVKRAENPHVIVNNLYRHTQLQNSVSFNMVALVDGRPQTLGLKALIQHFIAHRNEVVIKRTQFELRQARAKAHILEGLNVALENLDEVISIIKQSQNSAEAKTRLMAKAWQVKLQLFMEDILHASSQDKIKNGYYLSAEQAQAILDLRLHKLTGLEQDKIREEFAALLLKIKELQLILDDDGRLLEVVCEELEEIKANFADGRKTRINHSSSNLSTLDLIKDEEMVITLSKDGYIKSQELELYKSQRRGGKGKVAAGLKDEDLIDQVVIASTHAVILAFSNFGKAYWLKVHELPVAGRTAKGKPIINLLPLGPQERVTSLLAVREFMAEHFVFFATQNGTVKKCSLEAFMRSRSNGLIAIGLEEGDELIGTAITDGNAEIMLFATNGKAIRFKEDQIRCMGRTAKGVRGMRTKHKVISLLALAEDGEILCATEHGYGKKTKLSAYAPQNRGGQGVIAIKTNIRNGALVGALQVEESSEILLLANTGNLVRIVVKDISTIGRNTQGVKLINLNHDEKLVGMCLAEAVAIEADNQDS